MKYKDFTAEDWSYIVFTDEVAVEKEDDVTDFWVFRRLGERNRCLPGQVRPRVKSSVSLMLWGCFAGCFKGPLIPLL